MAGMHWHQAIDIYCERTDALFWAEPINAWTNLAFLAAAALALARWLAQPKRDWPALALILIVAAIGVGSFLFHTYANRWSLLADVIPIQFFMLGMFGLMLMRLSGWPLWAALLGAVGFLAAGLFAPRAAALVSASGHAGALAGYGVGLLAMLVLGFAARFAAEPPRRDVGALVLWAAVVFTLSLTFRTLDEPLCQTIPIGTHFLWHLFNALTLWLLLTAAMDLFHARTIGAIRSARARAGR
jgi:hypothetical protein